MKFHVLIKKSSLDGSFAGIKRNLCQQKSQLLGWLAVDKSRKNCIEMMMKEISPWLFPLHNSHPGLWIYYIYVYIYIHFFLNRGQSNHNLFLWYLLTPCTPCTPCTNDLNLLQKPVSLVSDVALVMVTRPFAGDHRSSPVQADISILHR